MADMDIKELALLLPVLGVIIGWLLNELGDRLRANGDTRRRVGESLAVLLSLRRDMANIVLASEQFKDRVTSWKEYEPFRQRALRRQPNFQLHEASDERLDETAKTIAGVDPVLGYRLLNIIGSHKLTKRSELTALSTNPQAYIPAISILEAGLELNKNELEAIIRRLAFKMGVVTWLAVLRTFREEEKSLNRNIDFAGKVSKEIFDNAIANRDHRAASTEKANADQPLEGAEAKTDSKPEASQNPTDPNGEHRAVAETEKP